MNLTSINPENEQRRTCDDCDTMHAMSRHYEVENLQYGAGEDAVTLEVTVPVWRCGECDSAYTDEQADDLRHEAVCRYLGRLTPREIQEFRANSSLTQSDLAKLGNFGIASIKRWETGEQIPSASASQHLRLLMLPGVLAAVRAQERPIAHRTFEPRFRTKLSDRARRDAHSFMLRPKLPARADAELCMA